MWEVNSFFQSYSPLLHRHNGAAMNFERMDENGIIIRDAVNPHSEYDFEPFCGKVAQSEEMGLAVFGGIVIECGRPRTKACGLECEGSYGVAEVSVACVTELVEIDFSAFVFIRNNTGKLLDTVGALELRAVVAEGAQEPRGEFFTSAGKRGEYIRVRMIVEEFADSFSVFGEGGIEGAELFRRGDGEQFFGGAYSLVLRPCGSVAAACVLDPALPCGREADVVRFEEAEQFLSGGRAKMGRRWEAEDEVVRGGAGPVGEPVERLRVVGFEGGDQCVHKGGALLDELFFVGAEDGQFTRQWGVVQKRAEVEMTLSQSVGQNTRVARIGFDAVGAPAVAPRFGHLWVHGENSDPGVEQRAYENPIGRLDTDTGKSLVSFEFADQFIEAGRIVADVECLDVIAMFINHTYGMRRVSPVHSSEKHVCLLPPFFISRSRRHGGNGPYTSALAARYLIAFLPCRIRDGDGSFLGSRRTRGLRVFRPGVRLVILFTRVCGKVQIAVFCFTRVIHRDSL